MSGDQLDFIGDEVYFRLPLNSTDYQTMGWRRPDLNQYILQYVHEHFPNIIFANYDNWHKEGNNWVWGKDGEAEMIVIQLRRLPGDYDYYYWNRAGVGGEAHLFGQSGISVSYDNTTITNDDGITATQGLYRTSHLELVLEHEISHHIFAGEFNHIGFNPCHVSVGMMTEYHSHSTFCMTPMERSMNWQLDWVVPYTTDPGQTLWSFNLLDEFEYGDAVKVSIPKANESDPQEYLWITNHQKKSRYDGISRGSNDCFQNNQSEIEPFCSIGKGLYIFHESDRFCDNNINGYNDDPLINTWRHYAFDLKSALGRWNWDLDTHVIDQYLGALDIQKIVTRNIITGVNKFNKRFLRAWPNYSAQLLSRDLCWNPPNYKISADFHGDGKEAYNVDYNNILSPYSNSSSNNYHSPTFNTGLTIYLVGQNPESGAMYIQVCYDDNYAQTHYPPAKPQNLKVTPSFIIQGVSYYPRLTWEQNLEPNFINNGTYKIYRGLSSNCNIEPQLNNYGYVATVGGNITEFIDYSMLLYNGSSGNDNCPTIQQNVSYKITANLNNRESVKSERSLIQGYFINCLSENANDKYRLVTNSQKVLSLNKTIQTPLILLHI